METQYKYDPFGRRIEKNVNGQIIRYVYDGDNILNEYDGAGNLKSKYVFNLGIDDPLSIEQAGSVYYYHKDGLGSVTELTNAAGSVAKTYRYNSFGEIYSQTGSLIQPFTFTGREYDHASGLYYYRARYYDPAAGVFLGKDPIGFDSGERNLFRYEKTIQLIGLILRGWSVAHGGMTGSYQTFHMDMILPTVVKDMMTAMEMNVKKAKHNVMKNFMNV